MNLPTLLVAGLLLLVMAGALFSVVKNKRKGGCTGCGCGCTGCAQQGGCPEENKR